MYKLLFIGVFIFLTSCSDSSNNSNDDLSSGQIRQVNSICNEFDDPDMKRQCLIDAFGSAAVTGRSSN